jgi:hypothetical protein
VSGGTAGSSTARFFADVNTLDMDALGNIAIDASAWAINDPANVLGTGGSYGVSVSTSDAATNIPFDTGSETVAAWLTGVFATSAGPVVSTTATVDVGTNRVNFVATAPDTLTTDGGATLAIDEDTPGVFDENGITYVLTDASRVAVTLSGNLSGIASWSYGGIAHVVTAGEVTAGASTLNLLGDTDDGVLDGAAYPIVITVDGTTVLSSRVLTIGVNLQLAFAGVTTDGPAANNRTLLAPTTVTTWSLNGTILISNWTNGNNAVFQSRLYIWNPSPVAGQVTARVFTLPLAGGANAQVGATVIVGTLDSLAGMNIRLAEDILTPAGVTLPYVTDGGNLVVELTIEANNINGYGQTFTSTQYAGVAPLNRVQ